MGVFKWSLFFAFLAVSVVYYKPNLVLHKDQGQVFTTFVDNSWIQVKTIFQKLVDSSPPTKQASVQSSPKESTATPPSSSPVNDETKSKLEFATSDVTCGDPNEILMTKEQLALFDGSEASPGLYLAFLGKIYDVEKGRKHYGPGGSYEIFAGRDASRSYISGEFTEEELSEDISGLDPESYSAVKEWNDFYQSEYKYVGKVIGHYYDQRGCETENVATAWNLVKNSVPDNQEDELDEQLFPPCNAEWDQEHGQTRYWCTELSGGSKRGWVGLPRQLFLPKYKNYRCACIKDFGPPTTSSIEYAEEHDDGKQGDHSKQDMESGDLHNARVREYEGCDPKSIECTVRDN